MKIAGRARRRLLFLPPLPVERLVHLAELFVREMGVDLRGRDVGVAEELLHGAEVGAVHEEVGGKAVAEEVRVDLVRDARLCGACDDEALDGALGDGADHAAAAVDADEEPL